MVSTSSIPVFMCDMCGDCCKMSPISVLPHEEVILKKLGELLDVDVRFTPGYTVYEAIRGVNLAFSYVMQLNTGGQCPFLRNNKCTIHYIYKPYICRSFPYIPRHVKYSIDEVNKYITASTDYGLSLACHIVKKDREALEKLGNNIPILYYYLRNEYLAAKEAENVRSLFLLALSKLWREGIVELQPARLNAPVVNLYDFLRQIYPDLPTVLRVDKIIGRVKKWTKTY
ncbi:MAG: YkgJ family cysteine cluster protein [Desulfurococcaceae archaeon]